MNGERRFEKTLRAMASVSAIVCAIDIFETVRTADSLPFMEENAFAASLISVEYEVRSYHEKWKPEETRDAITIRTVDVSRLVLFKTLGMIAAIYVFDAVIRYGATRISFAVVGSVFLIQLALLIRLVT